MDNKNSNRRTRRVSKIRTDNPEARDWWLRLYKLIDEYAAIPKHRRLEVLNEIFPEKILHRILTMMSLVEVETNLEQVNRKSIIHRLDHGASSESLTKLDKDTIHQQKSLPSVAERKEVHHSNPYLRFHRRPCKKAAIWRAVPEIDLADKAKAITEKIAIDFVRWLKRIEKMGNAQFGQDGESLGIRTVKHMFEEAFRISDSLSESSQHDVCRKSYHLTRPESKASQNSKKSEDKKDKKSELAVSDIINMFEIDVDLEAAKSLEVLIKELPAVPQQIAESRKISQRSIRETLHRYLRSDMNRCRKKEKLRAFSVTLPRELRYKPPFPKYVEPWYQPLYCNQDVDTMATVWEGITDLRSTKGYCKWLREHPEATTPKYLEKAGLLDPQEILKYNVIYSQMSVGSVTRLVGAAGEMQKKIGIEGPRGDDDNQSLGSFQLHVL